MWVTSTCAASGKTDMIQSDMAPAVSIKEIAKLAGVSPATVSRAINDRKYVRPEVRQRILAVVKKTGYVPNYAARSMVLRRTFTVGIVVPDTFNMFQRQLFSTMERELEVYGYRTLFFFVKWERGSEQRCLRRLQAENLDGVIMIHEVADPAFYSYLSGGRLPVVLCPIAREDQGFYCVHIDEEKAARDATEYLISLGHKEIGLITGTHFSFPSQRSAGYKAALEGAGLAVDQRSIATVESYSADAGCRGMRELLSRGGSPSAVFAITDELAIGVVRALYEAGLDCPGDVSVLGFDDIDIAPFLAPGLTTVRQPIREMGRTTAELMFRLIAGEDCGGFSRVFPYELVVRESCRAPV